MSQYLRPTYAERFRCIGSHCEENCCQGWKIPIDLATYEKYQSLPASPLRVLINESIQISPIGEGGAHPARFAEIRMNGSNPCPLLTEECLCGIQKALGGEYLSHTCSVYPRILYSIQGIEEKALTLSCPEAARLVLNSSNLLEEVAVSNGNHDDLHLAQENERVGIQRLLPHFWSIRTAVLALIANRRYLLWQRLFLLGIFCRRLDAIAAGELKREVPAFLSDFASALATGSLRPAMATLPFDREAQLDAVLRLAGIMLHRSNVFPRFAECAMAFANGIGNGPGATLSSLTAHFSHAHDRYYAPYFERHPQMLENYLINAMLRNRFPFGRKGMEAANESTTSISSPTTMSREYAILVAQFALMKGLLIGVAGFHREAFSFEHVLHTVQAATKHFEHHPEFLDRSYQLLVESRLDGARGLAILLRNVDTVAPRPATPVKVATEPQSRAEA